METTIKQGRNNQLKGSFKPTPKGNLFGFELVD